MKRLPFTDAFVDESIRGRRYLMACVMAEARHLPEMRLTMRDIALHQRVHFNNESTARKRLVLSVIAGMPITAFVAVAQRGHGASEFAARNAYSRLSHCSSTKAWALDNASNRSMRSSRSRGNGSPSTAAASVSSSIHSALPSRRAPSREAPRPGVSAGSD